MGVEIQAVAQHISSKMTLEQIVQESSHLSQAQLAELLDRLAVRLHGGMVPEVEESWRQEVRQRIADIEGGREKGLSGEEVSARIRKIVGR